MPYACDAGPLTLFVVGVRVSPRSSKIRASSHGRGGRGSAPCGVEKAVHPILPPPSRAFRARMTHFRLPRAQAVGQYGISLNCLSPTTRPPRKAWRERGTPHMWRGHGERTRLHPQLPALFAPARPTVHAFANCVPRAPPIARLAEPPRAPRDTHTGPVHRSGRVLIRAPTSVPASGGREWRAHKHSHTMQVPFLGYGRGHSPLCVPRD